MRKPSERSNKNCMKIRKNIFCAIALILVCSLAFPSNAHARGFFRGLITGVRNVATFVIQTPAKIVKGATRPLGPIIGPIAGEILLAQLPSNIVRIVDKAQRVRTVAQDIGDQQAKIDAGKKIIRERRQQLAEARDKLYALKSNFSQALLSRGMTFQQYKEKIAELERIKGAMKDVDGKLVAAEKNLRPENLARLLARDALRQLPGKIQGVVFRQVDDEVSKLINPEIIDRLLSKRPLKPGEVIDMVLDGDIKRILRDKSRAGDKAFIERVKAGLKEAMKDEGDLLKDDWRERLENKINEIAEQTTREEIDGTGVTLEENASVSEDAAGAAKIGAYFGDAICVMSDPEFWESFADKLVNGKGGSTTSKAEQQQMFLKQHGYTNDDEAKADLVKYWGSDAFKGAVKARIGSSCPAAFENEKLKLDDLLNNPQPP